MSRIGAREIRIGLIALAALLIIAMLVQAGKRPAPPRPVAQPSGYHGLPDPNVDPKGTQVEMKALVARTGGDYWKLTNEEMVWVEGLTANHGRQTLAMMAEQERAKAAKTKKRNTNGFGAQRAPE